MKKAICFLLVCVLILSLSSCSSWTTLHAEGIENFHSVSNSCEVDWYLLPTEDTPSDATGDFIAKFPYIEANYWYDEYVLTFEKSFAYFAYSPENYQKAMDFATEKMPFVTDVSYSFAGYTFLLRDMSAYYMGETSRFPSWFWMMFYSEERHVIGFFGYSCSPSDQAIRADEDFEGFVRNDFSYFDWDK
ncbi:MAG: hypothetical protein MJ088_00695 [Clostridia bacterium]|nr:hypothetical protein [Clostridia bacterium]